MDIDTYQHPGVFHSKDATTPAVQGCQLNPFDPALSFAPSTKAAHAPSGVDAELSMPQDVGADGIAEADVKTATVTLPEGMTINPSSADGLQACSDSDLRLRQEGAASCPDASKLGTVSLVSPLLDHSVDGSIFLRPQNSDDPASGELFRIAVELRSDDDGVAIRLPGAIKADPATGRLTTVFDDLPQLPFSSMKLHFKTGPRAPLASPPSCGTHTVTARLVSWSGRTVDTNGTFSVDQDCGPRGFAPALTGGVTDPTGCQRPRRSP